jgi:uncharacterized protein (TIRG00374 family)
LLENSNSPAPPAGPDDGRPAPKLWGWHTCLSIGITLVLLIWLASLVDLKKIWQQVSACHKGLVLLAGMCHYLAYPVRGLRWRRCMVHLPIRGGPAKFGLVIFFYNFVDNVVPAKLGDVYGAHLARINFGIRRSTAIGSIVFLRMADGWIVLGLGLLASWMLFSNRLPPSVLWSLIGGGILATAVTISMLAVFLLKKSLPGWVPDKVVQIIRAFQSGMWPRAGELIAIGIYSALIWLLETLWIYILALAFGLRPTAVEAVFLTMIPLMASAFPLTPSGTGVVELTLFSCLRVLGVGSPAAASLTVVNRLVDYWLHIALGALLWSVRKTFGLRSWREVPLDASIDAGQVSEQKLNN